MPSRFLALAVLAAASVAGFGQTAPPYTVQLNVGTTTITEPDVLDVHGLNIPRLLSGASDGTPRHVPKKMPFSFMRDWDGFDTLEALVGNTPNAADTVVISPNASNGSVTLGTPAFDRWTLHAENGVMASETLQFTYSTRQVVATQ